MDTFSPNTRQYTHTFVSSLPIEAVDILAADFLEKSGAVSDFDCGKISLTDKGRAPQVYGRFICYGREPLEKAPLPGLLRPFWNPNGALVKNENFHFVQIFALFTW